MDPIAGVALPVASVAIAPLTGTEMELAVVPDATCNETVATTPDATEVLSTPKRTHCVLPVLLKQETLFPAALPLAPTLTATLVIVPAGYPSFHCRPAGAAPPVFVKERFRLTLLPGFALLELSVSAACWATAA